MRVFNTSGACIPEEHYTLMREALVAQGEEHVRRGRYFTLFAPRQSGKTTYFQLLFRQLSKQGYLPIWLSMENLKTVTRAEFYDTFNYELQQELTRNGLVIDYTITNQVGLQHVFDKVRIGDTKVVLVLDEFESIPEIVLSELLHTFRKIYHRKVYDAFYVTLKYFLTERYDKNILNIIQKAHEKKAFMVKLLFGEAPIAFTVNDPTIAYLYANGVIDLVDGYVQIAVPLYRKALIAALRPPHRDQDFSFLSPIPAWQTTTG